MAARPGFGLRYRSYLLPGAVTCRVARSHRDGNGRPGGPGAGLVGLGVRIPRGDPAPHRRGLPGHRRGAPRNRRLGAPGACRLLPHRPGRPDRGCPRSTGCAARRRRCALAGGVDGVSPRLPATRPRRRYRLTGRWAGRGCRHASVSACHEARALDQGVRRSEADTQKDPRSADQSVGRLVVGERAGGRRLHGSRRA